MKKFSTLADNLSCASANCLNYIKMTILAIPLFVLLTQQSHAAAASSGITYTGRILDSSDQPVTASQVLFTIVISDPDVKCWLYKEQRMIDMTSSAGNFSFEVGSNDPTTLYGTPSLNNPLGGGPATFADIFDNSKSFTSLVQDSYTCPGQSYNPSTSTDKNEGRVMAIYFSIAGGTAQALPALRITPVPMAMQAINSVKVNGYDKNHLLRIDQNIASPVNSDINATQLAEFFRLVNAPGTAYLSAVPSLSGDVTGTVSANTVSKIQNIAVTAPTTGDSGKVLTYNGTNLVWQTAASSAITSLNGLTTASQSFATGTSGTDFGIFSSGSAHTFNLPTASATNRGALSSADWSTFNSKQSSALGAAQVWIGNASGGAQAQTLSGDATVSAAGVVTVDKTQSGAASKILQLDGSGVAVTQGVDVKGAGAGSVQLRYANSGTSTVLTFPASSGTANQFLQTDGTGNLSWASQSAMLPTIGAGQVWVGNASGGAQAFSLSGDVLSVSNTGAVTLTTSATGSNKLPLAGGSMSGAINMGGNNITNAGDVSLAAGKFLGLGAGSTDGTVAGQIWYDTGVIKYFDGTTVKSLGVAGAGITNLNGLTAGTQSFVNGTAGNAPAFSSAGSAHTLDIPMASSAGSVTAGLISNVDYVSFSGKQSSALASTEVWVGNASGVAQARVLSGDISISNVGLVTADKSKLGASDKLLQLDASGVANSLGIGLINTGTVRILPGTPATASYDLKLPVVAPANNQILKSNASGDLSWVTYLAQVSDSAPLANGKMWIGNASGVASEVAMSGDATIDNAGLLTLKNTGSVGTYSKVVTDAQGRVVSGSALLSNDVTTALGYTPVNRAGDSMSGDLTSQNISMVANKYFKLSANSTDGTVAGQIWYDTGVIKYFDGSAVKSLGIAGAGITTLNGLSSVTQTFAAGTAGTDFAISSAGSGHTFNLPSASASNRGALTSADWSTFNAKQSTALTAGSIWVGNSSGGAQAFALSGDIGSVSNTGLVTLKNTGTLGTYSKVVTDAQGRVTSGSALTAGDITTALNYTPVNKAGDTMTGNLTVQSATDASINIEGQWNSNLNLIGPGTQVIYFGADNNIFPWMITARTDGTLNFTPTSNVNDGSIPTLTMKNKNIGIGTTSPQTSLDLSANTDALRLPSGTTGQRPGTPVSGDIRYNSTNSTLEAYVNGSWVALNTAVPAAPDAFSYRQVGINTGMNATDNESYYMFGQAATHASNQTGVVTLSTQLMAIPFITTSQTNIDRLIFNITTAGSAGAKVRIGIYTNTSGTMLYPKNLLLDAGEFAGDLTGVVTVTVSTTLPANSVVWCAVWANDGGGGTKPVVRAIRPDQGQVLNILGWNASMTNQATAILQNTPYVTGTAFPATFPTGATRSNGNIPAIGMRFN